MTIPLRCRLGWHDWCPWAITYRRDTRYFFRGVEVAGTREQTDVAARTCAKCGKYDWSVL